MFLRRRIHPLVLIVLPINNQNYEKKLQPKARVKRLPARVRIKPSRQRGVGVSTIISMLILPLLCCLSLTSKAVLIRDSTG